jgi:saccharopine dehydrogenase-like NADP-dependent oxidoreductase
MKEMRVPRFGIRTGLVWNSFLEVVKMLYGIGMFRRRVLTATVTNRNVPRRIASSMSRYATS